MILSSSEENDNLTSFIIIKVSILSRRLMTPAEL